MTHQKRSVLEIPLFQKIYNLYRLIDHFTPDIPKAKRYTLWQLCEQEVLKLLKDLIGTSHQMGDKRVQALLIMSQRVDLLKVFFRLCKDTKTLNEKNYLSVESLLQEIGKMVGGWLKSVSR